MGQIDRLLDSVSREIAEDREHREYNILRTRVLAAASHTDIAYVAARITRFVQEDHNPVYADRLVSMLMEQGYKVINDDTVGSDVTYALMSTRLITRHIQTTLRAYQGASL